jgi:TetR/AcrR family transcriptional regulator, regulator of cefoperazone and chloramphenicol sensitivity
MCIYQYLHNAIVVHYVYVSPALVVHYFGSKDGLREAVDQHVLGLFEALFGEMTAEDAPDLYDPTATGSLAEAIVRHLPPGWPVPGYLRRLPAAPAGT